MDDYRDNRPSTFILEKPYIYTRKIDKIDDCFFFRGNRPSTPFPQVKKTFLWTAIQIFLPSSLWKAIPSSLWKAILILIVTATYDGLFTLPIPQGDRENRSILSTHAKERLNF